MTVNPVASAVLLVSHLRCRVPYYDYTDSEIQVYDWATLVPVEVGVNVMTSRAKK
jgi:hypothetical protein